MKHRICSYVLLIVCLQSSSIYAEKSLWGDIDNTVPASESVELKGLTPAQIGTTSTSVQTSDVVTATVVAQKSTCDVLRAQSSLNQNNIRTSNIQDALRNNTQFLPAQYKNLVANQDSLNSLYTAYRQQYLKTYCSRL